MMCEYMHAMGNSMGGIADYWDLIRSKPNLIGGYIWDMIDQGLLKTTDDGKEYYAYGGDFGDNPHNENFCLNGVFAPDRTPNPHAWEAKYVFQPAEFTLLSAADFTVRIKSRLSHTTLEQYDGQWALYEDGRQIQSGKFERLTTPAGESSVVTIPVKKVKFNDSKEYWLRVSLHEAGDRLWCSRGAEVAKERLLLRERKTATSDYKSTSKSKIAIERNSDNYTVSNSNFSAQISTENGFLTSYIVNSQEIIKSPLTPNFIRPSIDNDLRSDSQAYMTKSRGFWEPVVDALVVKSIVATPSSDSCAANVAIVYADIEGINSLTIDYTIFSDGMITVALNADVAATTPDLIRFGMTMGVPSTLVSTSYYGYGPYENYPDRLGAVEMGEYSLATDKVFFNYIQPQENGNHTGCQWLNLKEKLSSKGGLKVVGTPEFAFSVWPYTAENIDKAVHTHELKDAGYYTLNIDLTQAAVGGTLSAIIPKYELKPGKYSHSFMFGYSK